MVPFPSIEHRVYNYTFLLNTFTALYFDERTEANCGEDVKSRLVEFLSDSFQSSQKNPPYPDQNIYLQRSDHEVDFLLTNNKAMVRIGRKVYRTFGATLLPEASKIRRFVYDVLNIQLVKKVEVRKISLFPIELENQDVTPESVRDLQAIVLSDNVLSLTKVGEDGHIDDSVAPFTHHVMYDEDTQYRYDILLGVMRDSSRGANACNVILDVSCSYSPDGGISSGDVERNQIKMNKYIYDLYHWAVKDKVLEVMRREVNDAE